MKTKQKTFEVDSAPDLILNWVADEMWKHIAETNCADPADIECYTVKKITIKIATP